MSNKHFMSHTNATIGVVTFDPSEEDPLAVNALVHHVIGWVVNETAKPIPISTSHPAKWFTNRKFYAIFLPEGVVIDPAGEGTSLNLEQAIQYFQGELLTKEKEEKPKPVYKH